jgi:hypothetical protein
MRIGFVPIVQAEEFERACEWARQRGQPAPRRGLATWWVRRVGAGETIGIVQRAEVPVVGLVLDPEHGVARETVAVMDALRHAAELGGETPLVITHEDSAMAGLHERMLESAGDKTRVYWFRKTEG